MSKIIVVGSSNTDMVVHTSHLPAPGETILGGKFLMNQGGKGANQAVAVKRLGGDLLFVARVGNDVLGQQTLIAHLLVVQPVFQAEVFNRTAYPCHPFLELAKADTQFFKSLFVNTYKFHNSCSV